MPRPETPAATLAFEVPPEFDGLRLDAIPYLIERDGTNCENLPEGHDILKEMRKELDAAGVHLLSAGLDEAPIAYKNIDEVMAAQADLVRTLGKFTPKIVKMAPEGEKPED